MEELRTANKQAPGRSITFTRKTVWSAASRWTKICFHQLFPEANSSFFHCSQLQINSWTLFIKDVLDDFVDSFADHKAAEVVQDAKLEMPSDDVETKITADFVEETLIQPIQKQDSLNTSVSLIIQDKRSIENHNKKCLHSYY